MSKSLYDSLKFHTEEYSIRILTYDLKGKKTLEFIANTIQLNETGEYILFIKNSQKVGIKNTFDYFTEVHSWTTRFVIKSPINTTYIYI